jgi:hypothetical protein
MSLSDSNKSNFETLRQAIKNGDAALMECQLVSTGEPVAVICAVNREVDQSLTFVPVAQLFASNPYSLLNPPITDHPSIATQDDAGTG